MISGVEFRSEQDPDVRRHVHPRVVQEVIVQASNEVGECRQWLMQTLTALLTKLMNAKVKGVACLPLPAGLLSWDGGQRQASTCWLLGFALFSSSPAVHSLLAGC